MSPFTRNLGHIFIEVEKSANDAYAFSGGTFLGVAPLLQVLGFVVLLAPTLAVDLALVTAAVLGPTEGTQRPLRALRTPLAPHSWVRRIAHVVGRAPAPNPYVDPALPSVPDPKPTTVLSLCAPRVRPAHVASELEVFWTGRGGSFALSFLALSLSARVLLVFVLVGLG